MSELTSQLAALKVERDDACKQLEASAELVQPLDTPSCDQAHGLMTAQAHEATACPYLAVCNLCTFAVNLASKFSHVKQGNSRRFKLQETSGVLPCHA